MSDGGLILEETRKKLFKAVVFIPAYNEEDKIGEVIKKIKSLRSTSGDD